MVNAVICIITMHRAIQLVRLDALVLLVGVKLAMAI
ncbi:Uncharacterised protein [Chlamydia trachomatis]|nr:Uncharacterised protein [Chlamydia trachomatis]